MPSLHRAARVGIKDRNATGRQDRERFMASHDTPRSGDRPDIRLPDHRFRRAVQRRRPEVTEDPLLRGITCITTAALTLTVAAACGGRADSDQEGVRETTLTFHEQLARGDAGACKRLTADGRRQLDGRAKLFGLDGCDELVEAVAAEYSAADRRAMGELRIRKVTIDGDRATVRDQDVVVPAELDGQLEINDAPTVLRRERGDWKIEDLG